MHLKTAGRQIILVLFCLFLTVLFSREPLAASRTFIKEYTYQASDLDSKVSSRTIALEQVKRLLLEEVGTYLSAETIVINLQLGRDKLTSLTAGIVQTEILDEKWDGKAYYLKAKMTVDPQETAALIAAQKDNSQRNRELEETSRKVEEALRKIKQLQEERAARPAEARQDEYTKAVTDLKLKEWIDRGNAFTQAGKYDEALEAFDNAIKADPSSPWALIGRGSVLNVVANYAGALKDLDRAAAIDPRNPWIPINRGISYSNLGDFRKGLEEADKAIKLDPGIAVAHIGRGTANLGLGNFTQALVDFDRALQLDPQNPFIYTTRAWAHNALGNRQKALEDFQKGLELAPNNAWMHYGIAVFYALSGEKKKALPELQKTLKLSSGLKHRMRLDRNLQSLWNDPEFEKMVE